MSFQLIFWSIAALAIVIAIPVVLVWTIVEHLRSKGSERRSGGGISTGVGAAMQELDRLVARPSVEHQVETEHPVLKREDDAGGDQ
jgi:hypothetical protein